MVNFRAWNKSRNSFDSSCFMLKSIILWTIICVPGNIVTTYFVVYKHWASPQNTTNEHQNHSNTNENTSLKILQEEAEVYPEVGIFLVI